MYKYIAYAHVYRYKCADKDIRINAQCMNNQQAADISFKNRPRNSKITHCAEHISANNKITHCGEHISANTTPHQLHWDDREMGAAILCIKWGQMACLIQKLAWHINLFCLLLLFYTHRHTCTHTCTFHSLFIRSNGGTLDTYMVSPDSLSTLYCHWGTSTQQ